MEVNKVNSKRSATQLFIHGYYYKKNRFRKKREYWKCTKNECPVTLNRYDGDNSTIKINREHCHPPDKMEFYKKKFNSILKVSFKTLGCPIITCQHLKIYNQIT